MDLHELRCFVAVADALHFGRAAQKLGMMPSALGRYIRLLEADLGTTLFARTTRNVALTEDGHLLLEEAPVLLARADELAGRFRARGRARASSLKVGAIDSAAAGLLPLLLHDFQMVRADVAIHIFEDKTIKLLPKLLNGRLDLAFVRPPETLDKRIAFQFLFHETAVVAVPVAHILAQREWVTVHDLANEPLIVPERRSRPHSHDLTIKLFAQAQLKAKIAQIAEEKQTIVSLVAAGLGVAIVPRWISRMAPTGVRYVPLRSGGDEKMHRLPLAAAWPKGSRDPVR
ncbi:MAG: LysR family transcriptional regulator, partial [Hyphomicrobiales bacterium]|nr:LysR family transcriptional regulator [Hyphomicrobiales bacterium]